MAVERSRWTDERLDDLAERVVRHDAASDKVDDLGRDLVEEFARPSDMTRSSSPSCDSDLGGQITDMRRELYSTRWTVVGIWLGLAAIFIEIALRS